MKTNKHETKSQETTEFDATLTQDMTNVEQEIDYSTINTGPLYIDPKYLKPGHVHQFVSNEPGQIDMYKRWGYVVVDSEDIKVGQTTASTSSQFGSAVTVQSKCGRLLVLMRITQDNHNKLMAYRAKESQKREAALGKIEGVPDQFQQLDGKELGEYTIRRS